MFFVNVKGLVRDLRADKVTQREVVKYLIALAIFYSFTIYVMFFVKPDPVAVQQMFGFSPPEFSLLNKVFSVLVSPLGSLAVLYYLNNIRGNGKHLWARFTSIFWVTNFILMLAIILLCIVLAILNFTGYINTVEWFREMAFNPVARYIFQLVWLTITLSVFTWIANQVTRK